MDYVYFILLWYLYILWYLYFCDLHLDSNICKHVIDCIYQMLQMFLKKNLGIFSIKPYLQWFPTFCLNIFFPFESCHFVYNKISRCRHPSQSREKWLSSDPTRGPIGAAFIHCCLVLCQVGRFSTEAFRCHWTCFITTGTWIGSTRQKKMTKGGPGGKV